MQTSFGTLPLTRNDVHLFQVKDLNFLLDVEGRQLFNLSPKAYRMAEEKMAGTVSKADTFAQWRTQKELDAVWRQIFPLTHEKIAEAKRDLQGKPASLTGLWLGLAHTCNLACAYCFADESNYLKNESPFMSFDTARQAIDFLVSHDPARTEYDIIFFGGEPLLRLDVLKRTIANCSDVEKKEGKKFSYSITTNGTLLTKEVFDYLTAHGVSIMLSIDGTKAIHDANRPYRRGGPSWDDIIRNIQSIPDFEKYIIARVTVADTKTRLIDIYRTVRQIGFIDVAMVEICPNSGQIPVFPAEEIPEWKAQYLELAEYVMENEPNAYSGALTSLSTDTRSLRERDGSVYCCSTGINSFYVTPDGECYPCMRLITDDKRNLMGSMFSGIDAQKVEQFRANHVFNRRCRNCWARYLCGGMCYGDAFATFGDIRRTVPGFCTMKRHKIEVAAYTLKRLEQMGKVDPVRDSGWFHRVKSDLRTIWAASGA